MHVTVLWGIASIEFSALGGTVCRVLRNRTLHFGIPFIITIEGETFPPDFGSL
jgi:hypothetical protein